VHGRTAYDLSEADAKRFAPVFNSIQHLMARSPEILGTHYDIAFPGRQLKSARNLRALPLDREFRESNAYMGQFYGWERPLYFNAQANLRLTFDRPDWFSNVGDEVLAAHERSAVFDSSAFGKINVIGPDAEAFLLNTCAGHMRRPPGSVIYSAVLNQWGTFESDLVAQRISHGNYRLFVGTNSIKRNMAWLTRASREFDVAVNDVTERYAVLALMGPESARVIRSLNGDLNAIGFYQHAKSTIAEISVRAARLSYVGEAGWEITCEARDARALYAALIAQRVTPAGLFAQTSMRIEKAFCAM